jgi:hypothetical protein
MSIAICLLLAAVVLVFGIPAGLLGSVRQFS